MVDSPPHLSDRFVRVSEVAARQVGEGGVLLELTTGRYFELNATGWRIWALLGDGLSLAEVLARLESEFDASPGDLRNDLASLVVELQVQGLVRRSAAALG